MIALADSHVHLDRYAPDEVQAMLQRAYQVGVRQILTVGVDPKSSAAAVDLAHRHSGVAAAVGLHPKRLEGLKIGPAIRQLRRLARRPQTRAIGEIGLDEASPTPLQAQEEFLVACLGLAAELDLPVSLHAVGAHERTQELLVACGVGPRTVVHYFQGDLDLARTYVALGCYISYGKPVTRPERESLRDSARQVPLERLLLETDTYPLPGRTTEPRDLVPVCRAVAELRGIPFEAVAEATIANYARLFLDRRASS